MSRELVLVLDFGGQYNQLIARRVRECNVYCEVHPYNLSVEKIREMNPKGIIFTGGPNSVYGENSPLCDRNTCTWYLLWFTTYVSCTWRKSCYCACK